MYKYNLWALSVSRKKFRSQLFMRECRNALIQVLKNYEVDLTFHLKQGLHLLKKNN